MATTDDTTSVPLTPEERRKARNRAKQKRAYARDPEKHRHASQRYRSDHPEKARLSKKQYRMTHKEEIRQYNREYRQRHAAALKRYSAMYHAAYYAVHGDKVRVDRRAYYAMNVEQSIARTQAWRKANPDKRRHYQQQRRAKKAHSAQNDLTLEQWQEILQTYEQRCAYCGKRSDVLLTQDHITPLAHGGMHTASNIVPACISCNAKKGTNAPSKPVQPLLLTLSPSRRKKP